MLDGHRAGQGGANGAMALSIQPLRALSVPLAWTAARLRQ